MSKISCLGSGGCLPQWENISSTVNEVFSRIWQVICNCFRAIRAWCGAESVEPSPIFPLGSSVVETKDQFRPYEREVVLFIVDELLPGYAVEDPLWREKGRVTYRFSSRDENAPAVLCDCQFTDHSWEIALCKEEEKPSLLKRLADQVYCKRPEIELPDPIEITLSLPGELNDEECLCNEFKEEPTTIKDSTAISVKMPQTLYSAVGIRGVFVDQVLVGSCLLQSVPKTTRLPSPFSVYQQQLDQLRQNKDQELAYRVYTTPLHDALLPAMQSVWDSSVAVQVSSPSYYQSSLASYLEGIIEKVRRADSSLRESTLVRNGNKLFAVFNWADFHRNGNIPFLWGGGLGGAGLLRHPVPTIETVTNVELAPEYTLFLEEVARKQEKVLYCCLLNPAKRDELARITPVYREFIKKSDTAYFMRLPMDGSVLDVLDEGDPATQWTEEEEILESEEEDSWVDWSVEEDSGGSEEGSWEEESTYTVLSEDCRVSKRDQELQSIPRGKKPRYPTLEAYAAFVKESALRGLGASAEWDQDEFIFSTNVQKILLVNPQVFDQIQAVANTILKDRSKNIDIIKRQKAYYMLFCTLLRLYVIRKAGITYYNNTCKDAIDRGAAHLVSDLAFTYFCEGSLSTQTEELSLALTGPAFLAKTQAILADRAEWALCLCDVLVQAEKSEEFTRQLSILLDFS